ncbi:MAG: DUF2282 domain-containing protein [Deltaproteobacteria bacterium]|nr:MAG: DUF2282 domain-containing protein [Deltaproteobacteria bacterium]
MKHDTIASYALGAAAAFLLSACGGDKSATAQPEDAASADAKVKCVGINACKGQSQCDMPTHSCAGQNECKGKGWLLVTKSECDAKGGTPKA